MEAVRGDYRIKSNCMLVFFYGGGGGGGGGGGVEWKSECGSCCC